MSNNIYDILDRLSKVSKEADEPVGRKRKTMLEQTMERMGYDHDSFDDDDMAYIDSQQSDSEDALDYAYSTDMDRYGSDVSYDSLEDPDDPDYGSVANQRYRRDRDLKSRGQYAKMEGSRRNATSWFDAEREPNGQLIQNVTDRVMGYIKRNYPDADMEQAYEYALNNAYGLCHDWPEGEGFGTSDAYPAIKDTLSDLGLTEASSCNDEDKLEEAPGDKMATYRGLKGLDLYTVYIKNNYYNGKYPDYTSRPYMVVASSEEEAKQVVLNNADAILKDLLSKKLPGGKRVLPPRSALPITADEIGRVEQNGRGLTTFKPKTFFTPDGPQSFSVEGGKIVDGGVNEAAPHIGDKVTTRKNPLVFVLDSKGMSKGHMNLVTFMSIYGIDRSMQHELAQRVNDEADGQIPVRTSEGERVYIKYSPHTDKELGNVKEVAQKFSQGGKHYVTGGDEGDEVVKAFDNPQDAQKFMDINRNELNKRDPESDKITDIVGDEEMQESMRSFNPGDVVTVKENIKPWSGKSGRVTLVHEGHVYVKFPKAKKAGEVEFKPADLINHGITEAFGMYDDFDSQPADINPDLVPFDYENPEHRERLQRGTKVVLVPVLFQDQGTDRSGVLTDISKTGFFCKVIRSADGKTINAHMSDIELADLYNNTVYEDYNSALNKLLEDISVTQTENPENPELDTITITGTDEHVQLLSDLMKMAGLSDNGEESIPMVAEPEVAPYDDGEEEMLMQYREERDIEHANTPAEKVSTVRAATHGTSLKGLNGQKRQYRKEYPGDNIMTANEGQMNELDIILQEYPLEALQDWASGGNNYPEQLDQDLAEFMGYDDTGSGMAFERVWRELKDEVAAYVRSKQMGESQVNEKAPPGMEDWIKDRKAEFKDRYGDRWQEVLYATAWKQHNKESIGESNMNDFDRILAAYDPRELMAWAKGDSDAATDLADEILGLEGRWDTGSGMEDERIWNEYKDEVAAYAQEKMGMSESKRAGAALDEVDSFLNLYKSFSERGEKRS